MNDSALTNLGGITSRWANSGRIAYIDATGPDVTSATTVTFDAFDDLCGRVAGGLEARGLEPGNRVGILAANSVDYGACYLGIPRAAMVTVPLNTRQPAATLTWIAADADLQLVIHDEAHRDQLPEGVPAIELGSDDWHVLISAESVAPEPIERDEVAVQMYTSGSTGRPKGVLLSHRGQLFSIDQYLNGVLPMDPDERLMVSAPMYHKNAGMQLKMALSLGGTVILLRRFDAEDYLRAIEAHGATAVSGVPTMFALMFARPDLLSSLNRSSVRRASIGSAPMTQALFDQAKELFPQAGVTNGYGTTEVVAVFGGHPDQLPRPDIAVGYPLAAVETKLVDANFDQAVADDRGHSQGELWVRSPGLMVGYHQLEDVTAEKVTNGWYHTGDVMESDANGWHFFVGRVDDMFTCGGENVYPGDVEQLLERHELVHQASVVPVADGLKGELPVAFVVLTPEAAPTEAELRQWMIDNGPAYQHPRAVWFIDELPLAGTAKIDRAVLTNEAAQRWTPRAP